MKLISISIFISSLFILPVLSQNDSADLSVLNDVSRAGLFDSDDLLEVTLLFDIPLFRRRKFTNEQQDALMTYICDQDTVSREIRLRARGNFRRQHCNFPPIRLNLKENEPPDDIFSGVDKNKLVTHCGSGSSEYILKEYLVYKLYNVFTDDSFRVRLLKINYINTRRSTRPIIEYGFLIEPAEFLAERSNSSEITSDKLSQKHIKPDIMDRVAIFHYMIGNYDWSVPGLHNLVVLSQPLTENAHLGILVPYDFDYSGIVNADYAVPPSSIPIKSVQERLYRGVCRSEEEFRNSLDDFLEKREELYNVIREFPYMRERAKKDMLSFLDTFYQDFDRHNTIIQKLLNNCLNY